MFDLINCRFYSWRWFYLYCQRISSLFLVYSTSQRYGVFYCCRRNYSYNSLVFSIEIYTNAIMAYKYSYRIDWTFAATILWRCLWQTANHSRRYVTANQRAAYIVGLRSPCTRLFWGYIRRANCQFSSSCDVSKTSVDGDGFRECRTLEQPNKGWNYVGEVRSE